MNLYVETTEKIAKVGKTQSDVLHVLEYNIEYFNMFIEGEHVDLDEVKYTAITFDKFLENARKHFSSYSNGLGRMEVPKYFIIFKDGTWLERGDYDGSEWWDYKITPTVEKLNSKE